LAAIFAGEELLPMENPKWFVEVMTEEYPPLEFQPEKDNEYYVPIGLKSEHEEEVVMLVEALKIQQRVLDKESPTSLNNLAWFWATCPEEKHRNGAKAIEYATRACELTNWENVSYVDTLAAAYAEADDFDSAVKWQKKAIELITEENPVQWRIEFTERLELYQSGKAYRQSQ
jgi:tetratricopeptide (TPR) repeat protein